MIRSWAIMKNGVPEIFKGTWVRNTKRNLIHSNPTEAQMRDCGYKEYVIDDTVLEEKGGFYIGVDYEETETQIIQTQKYVEIVDEPDEYYEDIPTEDEPAEEIVE